MCSSKSRHLRTGPSCGQELLYGTATQQPIRAVYYLMLYFVAVHVTVFVSVFQQSFSAAQIKISLLSTRERAVESLRLLPVIESSLITG